MRYSTSSIHFALAAFVATAICSSNPLHAGVIYSNNFDAAGSAGSGAYASWNVQTGSASSVNDTATNGWWNLTSSGATAWSSIGLTGITGVAHNAGDTFEVSATITVTGASTGLGLSGSLPSTTSNNIVGIRLIGASNTVDTNSVWADINFGGTANNMGRVRLVDNINGTNTAYPSGTQANQPLIGGTSSGSGTFNRAPNIQGDKMFLDVIGTWQADGSLRFTVTATDTFDNETVSWTTGVGTGDVSAANITSFFSGTSSFFGFRIGGSASGGGTSVHYDNFSVSVASVPEPSGLALAALAALVFCMQRRLGNRGAEKVSGPFSLASSGRGR